MVAILPILPAIGSLLWLIVVLISSGVFLAFSRRCQRQLVAFLKSQWRGLAVLAGIGMTLPAIYSISVRALTEPSPKSPRSPIAFIPEGWPTSRGSLARLGSDGTRGPRSGGVNWVGRRDYVFFSSPAICGKYVVAIGSRGDSARCFCWDVVTGAEVWNAGPGDYRMTLSSPILVDGRIVCGEGVHHTPRARVVCLDPASGHEEGVAWEFATTSHVECTPAFDNGRVYVAAGDDGVYCFEGDLRHPADQRVRWHISGDQLPDAETALAVHAGRVYVGLGHGGNAMVALSAETGHELSRAALPLPVFSPPAIFGVGLLIGLGPGNLVNAPTAGAGELRLLDLATLQTRWRLPTTASVLSAPAVVGHEAVICVADGHVLVVDQTGNVRRQWRSPSPILTSPAVSLDMIYCVDAEGLLVALDLQRMEPVWQVRLGPSGLYVSSPVVARGRVVVGTPEGFMCVGTSPQGN